MQQLDQAVGEHGRKFNAGDGFFLEQLYQLFRTQLDAGHRGIVIQDRRDRNSVGDPAVMIHHLKAGWGGVVGRHDQRRVCTDALRMTRQVYSDRSAVMMRSSDDRNPSVIGLHNGFKHCFAIICFDGEELSCRPDRRYAGDALIDQPVDMRPDRVQLGTAVRVKRRHRRRDDARWQRKCL